MSRPPFPFLLAAVVFALATPATLLAQAKTAVLQAADLTKEYATDEAAADKKYKLKMITVEGTIESFPKNREGKKDIVLKGHEAGIGVFCNELPADAVEKLKEGDKVRVAGIAAGKIGPWIAMGGCKFVTDSSTTPAKKPADKGKETTKSAVVRGKAVAGLVTAKSSAWKVVGLVPNLAYIADRDYAIKKFPKEMDGGHVVIRDSGQINDWLGKGQLTLAKDATVYVAMLVKMDGREVVTDKQFDAMAGEGWAFVKEPFETTTPDKSWEWQVAMKTVKKGDVDLPLPKEISAFKTHVIYVFK